MDSENELARAKWLLIGLAVMVVSGCVTYGELSYLLFGRTADAEVLNVFESTGRRGGTSLNVEFTFREPDGTQRKGIDTVSLDWPRPVGGRVAVQYTPGANGNSRLAGHRNWIGLTAFGLSLVAVGVFGFRLWREASEATGGSARKRAGR